jgi:hypothetical protein
MECKVQTSIDVIFFGDIAQLDDEMQNADKHNARPACLNTD